MVPETILDFKFIQFALVCRHTTQKYEFIEKMVFFHGCPQVPFSKKTQKKTKPKAERDFGFSKALPPQTNPTYWSPIGALPPVARSGSLEP